MNPPLNFTIDAFAALIGTLVTVSFAFWLRSVWALIIGQIAEKATQALLSYIFVEGKPKFGFTRAVAVELLSYGKFITAASAVLFVALSLDTAVIGKLLGPEQLGFYVLAFTLANLATSRLSKLVSGIMLPAYSKLQSDIEALQRAYLRTMTFVVFVCFPATVAILITADSVVHVLYGSKWANSILLVQILVVFGMLRSITSINGFLLQGIGKPNIPFYLNLVQLAVLLPLVLILTYEYGLPGAATAVTTAMFIKMVISLIIVKKVIAVPLKDMFFAVSDPLWKSLVMGALVFATGTYLDRMTGLGLATLVVVGISTYTLLNLGMIRQIRKQGLQR